MYKSITVRNRSSSSWEVDVLNGVLIHPWFLTSLLLINVYNNVTVIMGKKKRKSKFKTGSYFFSYDKMGETFTGN